MNSKTILLEVNHERATHMEQVCHSLLADLGERACWLLIEPKTRSVQIGEEEPSKPPADALVVYYYHGHCGGSFACRAEMPEATFANLCKALVACNPHTSRPQLHGQRRGRSFVPRRAT